MIRYFKVENDGKQRIDRYLTEQMSDLTRSHIQKLIEQGCVCVDERPVKANYRLAPGEVISCEIPEPKETEIKPENIPLDILYEDDDLLVVNKPKDMVVHPAPGHTSGTLVNALLYYLGDNLSGINGVLRPGIVHRIDKDTTGSLLVCKNDKAHQALAEQIKEHSIKRTYEAVVHGNIKEDAGIIDEPIGRSLTDRKKMSVHVKNARDAITKYEVLQRFGDYTYVRLNLSTGRTHQIRVHMAYRKHPVLGDPLYGPKKCPFPELQGQTLHAKTIGFVHPSTGEYMEVEAPLPAYFNELLYKLEDD